MSGFDLITVLTNIRWYEYVVLLFLLTILLSILDYIYVALTSAHPRDCLFPWERSVAYKLFRVVIVKESTGDYFIGQNFPFFPIQRWKTFNAEQLPQSDVVLSMRLKVAAEDLYNRVVHNKRKICTRQAIGYYRNCFFDPMSPMYTFGWLICLIAAAIMLYLAPNSWLHVKVAGFGSYFYKKIWEVY